MRALASIYHACLQVLAPAEGEEWLVGLAVALLLLGAARHRLEPWLAGIAADPPVGAAAAVEATSAARDSSGLASVAVLTAAPAGAPAAAGAAAPASALPPAVLRAIAPIELRSFGRVDVNRATAEELETLPRIGPALAQRIIADREANGPFATIADLDRVKGIGPATLAALAGDVVTGPPVGDSTRARGAPGRPLPSARSSAE